MGQGQVSKDSGISIGALYGSSIRVSIVVDHAQPTNLYAEMCFRKDKKLVSDQWAVLGISCSGLALLVSHTYALQIVHTHVILPEIRQAGGWGYLCGF